MKTGSDGYKSVSYDKLTAVLVEAIKELMSENHTALEQLKNENESLKAQLKKQQAMLEAILEKQKI